MAIDEQDNRGDGFDAGLDGDSGSQRLLDDLAYEDFQVSAGPDGERTGNPARDYILGDFSIGDQSQMKQPGWSANPGLQPERLSLQVPAAPPERGGTKVADYRAYDTGRQSAQKVGEAQADQFFKDFWGEKNQFNNDVEGVRDNISRAERELPPAAFDAFVRELGYRGGIFSLSRGEDGRIEGVQMKDGDRSVSVYRDSWQKDAARRYSDSAGEQFFNRDGEFKGDTEGLRGALENARQKLSPEEFKSFLGQLEKRSGGRLSHKEGADGSILQVSVRDKGVDKPVLGENNRAQRASDDVAREFFQDADGKFNNDVEGLRDAVDKARNEMSPEEFRDFVSRLEKQSGGAVKHTEGKDGKVDEIQVKSGDQTIRLTKDGSILAQDGDAQIRVTRDGKYFVTGPDGQEREFAMASADGLPPKDRNETNPARIKNSTDRPILVLANNLDKNGDKTGMGAFVVKPGMATPSGSDADGIVTDARFQPRLLAGKVLVPTEIPPDAAARKISGNLFADVTAIKDGDAEGYATYTDESGLKEGLFSLKGIKTDLGSLRSLRSRSVGDLNGATGVRPARRR